MNTNLKLVQDDEAQTLRSVLKRPETIMEVLASPPPVWQVQDLLIRGQTCVILGDSQSGKTFCALELAACVATGREFLGLQTKKGAVLYLAAEGGAGLVKRLRALISKYPDLPAADLLFWRDSIELESNRNAIMVRAKDLQKEIGLLVIDTLSQTFNRTGDENSSTDMAAYVFAAQELAKNLGCPVAIVHHSGKDSARGARGSSALRCNVDTMLMVNNKAGIRTATTDASLGGKQRDGEPVSFSFSLRQVEVGIGETSCLIQHEVLNKVKAMERKPMGGDQTLMFSLAKSMASSSKNFTGPSSRPVFSRLGLKQAWVAHHRTIEGGQAKAFESKAVRPLDKLIESGFLAWAGQGNGRPDDLWLADLP